MHPSSSPFLMAGHADYVPEIMERVVNAWRHRLHAERYDHHRKGERGQYQCRNKRPGTASCNCPLHHLPPLFFLSLEIRLHSDTVNEERARLLVSARVYHVLYIRRDMDALVYGGVRERVVVIELEVMLCAGVSRGVVPQVLLVRAAHEGGAVAEAQVVVGPAAWRRDVGARAQEPVALGDPLPLGGGPDPDAHYVAYRLVGAYAYAAVLGLFKLPIKRVSEVCDVAARPLWPVPVIGP